MSTSITLTGGLTAAYSVSDRKRTIEWYIKNLGFKLAYDVESIGWCEMESPIKEVYVGFSEVENPDVKGGPTLTWSVDDIEVAKAQLEANGVTIDGDIREYPGMVKLLVFRDPDGNHLMLSQSLSG